jgi:hypothetical protein
MANAKPGRSISDEEIRKVLHAYKNEGSQQKAADHLDMTKSYIARTMLSAKKRGITIDEVEPLEFPDLPSGDVPTQDLIDKLCDRFITRHDAATSREWFQIKVNVNGPFLLAFFGDPHMDDNGCNWPLLKRDVALVVDNDFCFGVGLGDYTNNWSGRLSMRLHPYQETTRPQAWQLAEWFFATVPWALLIKGNHDLWSSSYGTGDVLDYMARGAAPLEDWQAKVEFVQGDKKWRVWVAHDFPGSSIHNPAHGLMRRARTSGAADLYISGHKHNWSLWHHEDPDHRSIYWAARARGYKFMDDHATQLGYADQWQGATIAAIFDPSQDGIGRMQCFADLPTAISYLKFLRKKWKKH